MPVTADTPQNIVAGAGEVYKNQQAQGASMDNNVVRIDREVINPDLNGVKGQLLGTHYVRRSQGVLETTLAEISSAALANAWPGSSSATAGEVTTIDEDETRRIPLAAYSDWEVQWERLGGGEIQFEVDNALSTATAEWEGADDGFLGTRLELMSTWDPADLTASPHRWKILTGIS